MTAGGIITAAGQDNGTGSGGLAWATPASAASTVTTLNEQILLGGEVVGDAAADAHADAGAEVDAEVDVDGHADLEKVPVPALSGLAIALCTGVTVLFGVWPQPLIDFANHATLLFLPH